MFFTYDQSWDSYISLIKCFSHPWAIQHGTSAWLCRIKCFSHIYMTNNGIHTLTSLINKCLSHPWAIQHDKSAWLCRIKRFSRIWPANNRILILPSLYRVKCRSHPWVIHDTLGLSALHVGNICDSYIYKHDYIGSSVFHMRNT